MDAVSYAKSLGYYISTGEFGIKALRDGCFALLYIPHGAIVHVDGDYSSLTNYASIFFGLMLGSQSRDYRWDDGITETRKHRANKAYIVAVCKSEITRQEFVNEYTACEKFEIELKDVLRGYSIQDDRFEYVSDSWISISDYGIYGDEACAAGIHYFPGYKAAIEYHIRNTYERSHFPYTVVACCDGIRTRQDPYESSKLELSENVLPMILSSWMEHKISEFKCIHDDIYKYSHDSAGRTLFDLLTSTITNGFERAYLCRRVTGQLPRKNTTILKQQNNLTVNIGCNIYDGIPVEDEEETENDDDKPP